MNALPVDARLLLSLREHPEGIAPAELAAAAQIPPGNLPERIEGLYAAGYQIALVPHLGYRLLGSPDRLIADDLQGRLIGNPLVREVMVFEETSSTNDVAARLARSGAAEGVAIFAERQTAGRGRLGRRWISAAHLGLWFTLLLRPKIAATEWTRLTTWAALGVAHGLEAIAPGIRAGIKWPNDLLLDGKKAVGILIESGADTAGGYALVGIGVNVNHLADDLPEGIPATSLRLAAGSPEPIDRMATAAAILDALSRFYPTLHDDFPTIVAEAESRSLLMGRWIEVQTPLGAQRGMAERLNADGSLQLRGENGALINLSGGEVSILQW